MAASLALGLTACEDPAGDARIEARFTNTECRPGSPKSELEDYNYDASYLATERFSGVLKLMLQKYRVNVEEGDTFIIRVNIGELEHRSLLTRNEKQITIAGDQPLRLKIGEEENEAQVLLSLFGTCPNYPVNYAISGELVFTTLELALDPMDTGIDEHVVGTVTATMARHSARESVGQLQATFDFFPPRRPLTDFK